jgi:hypothetical protein
MEPKRSGKVLHEFAVGNTTPLHHIFSPIRNPCFIVEDKRNLREIIVVIVAERSAVPACAVNAPDIPVKDPGTDIQVALSDQSHQKVQYDPVARFRSYPVTGFGVPSGGIVGGSTGGVTGFSSS